MQNMRHCEQTSQRSAHEDRVRAMMAAFGQHVPESPEIPDLQTRKLRVRLCLEEVLELAAGYGLAVVLAVSGPAKSPDDEAEFLWESNLNIDDLQLEETGNPPDLVKIIDGHGDLSVVNVGGAAACGVDLEPVLELIDANNMEKRAGGYVDMHGKFVKPAGHRPPEICEELLRQGWAG